ncbi:MAG: hypothetical protein EZS28_004337 [Streblomastix strix]|uniref:Uncharacterized protein n=1 Tax=Streblomastix strix TaxID=222440 RepID=A0A5J4WYF8_9EUKA|nr:MAG: hypothetical protein EZS28_004337 [Streblomastix strix]
MHWNPTYGVAIFQNILKVPVKLELSELGLFVNFGTQKFTTKAPVATIDFWAAIALAKQNAEARRMEIQRPSLLSITNVPQSDQILGAKLNQFYKVLQSEHALVLCNLGLWEGSFANMMKNQPIQATMDMQNGIVHNIKEAERTYFAIS